MKAGLYRGHNLAFLEGHCGAVVVVLRAGSQKRRLCMPNVAIVDVTRLPHVGHRLVVCCDIF